jgi:hypothetical protein
MTLPGVFANGSAPAWVLLAAGAPAAVAALQERAGQSLAAALGMSLAAPLDPLQPDGALAALAARAGGSAALVPLPRDPGHPLADGRHWAEALGAWRQPAVVLLDAEQLETGLPAMITALLQQWQVPCVGLVQSGGHWDQPLRRRDGLLWLGALEPASAGGDSLPALRLAARARWAALLPSLPGDATGIRAC